MAKAKKGGKRIGSGCKKKPVKEKKTQVYLGVKNHKIQVLEGKEEVQKIAHTAIDKAYEKAIKTQ